jgi:hypothetical protein
MMTGKIIGLEKALKAIQRQGKKGAKAIGVGLKKGGLFLQRESQQLCPVEFGVLRNTAFTRSEGTEMNPEVRVGYTAGYALYVHENLKAHHPVGQAKFLEQPARQKQTEIKDVIVTTAKAEMKKP